MSANNIALLKLSVLLAGTVSAYRFIGWNRSVAVAGAASRGVADCDGVAGDMVASTTLGTAIVTSGAAVAEGALIEVGTAGKAITHDSGVIVGRALEAATAADQLFEVLLLPS